MQDTSHTHPLINRDYGLLWTGRTISAAGDLVFASALVVWIGLVLGRGQSWAPLAVSGALIASALPTALCGPIAGVFADRWDRRRAMLGADAVRFALLIPTPLILAVPLPIPSKLALAYAVVACLGVIDQLFRSAATGMIAVIVPEPKREQALGMGQAAFSLAMIAGPAVGAPLVLAFGIQWATLIDALSFAASFVAVRAIRQPAATVPEIAPRAQTVRADLAAGLHTLMTTRALRTLLAASAIAMLGGSALNALDLFFVTHNLHTPGAWYGLLDAIFGLGAIAGAVLAGMWGRRLGSRRIIPLTLLGLGAAVLIYARLGSFAPAALLLFGCGVMLAALQVGAGALILEVTPAAMIGRVSALLDPITVLASLAGTMAAGYLDAVVLRGFHVHVLGVSLGPIDTIFMGAGLLVLAGGLYARHGLRHPETSHRTRYSVDDGRLDPARG